MVIEAADEALSLAAGLPTAKAEAFLWKAQAYLALDDPDEALAAAEEAWALSPNEETCAVAGSALAAKGDTERAEELFLLGMELFPEDPHIRLRLAIVLSEQLRIPEALEILDAIDPETLDERGSLFYHGLKANILGLLGHWDEADETLAEGLERNPGAIVLEETGKALEHARELLAAETRLVKDWRQDLEPLEDIGADDIDRLISELTRPLGIPSVMELAARRLWRALLAASPLRPVASEAWATALLVAISRIDGEPMPVTAACRVTGASRATVHSALRKIQAYLDTLEPRFLRTQFAALTNPRLEDGRSISGEDGSQNSANVVRFPGVTPKGGTS